MLNSIKVWITYWRFFLNFGGREGAKMEQTVRKRLSTQKGEVAVKDTPKQKLQVKTSPTPKLIAIHFMWAQKGSETLHLLFLDPSRFSAWEMEEVKYPPPHKRHYLVPKSEFPRCWLLPASLICGPHLLRGWSKGALSKTQQGTYSRQAGTAKYPYSFCLREYRLKS